MIENNFIQNKFGYCFYEVTSQDAVIFNLYIHPEYRRQGKAKKLLQQVIREIKEQYDGEIIIEACQRESSIDSENLILFYKKMGLKILNGVNRCDL